jgi:cellulose synthase/poly-beta-1,6-N-acetylglucosamine synthase-like glycosyltransferase
MALHRQTALSYSSLSFYHYPCNSKKEALTYALTKMEDEHILLTDDDCMPYSSSWLPAMLYCLDENELDIVLGYSPFKKLNNSVFTSWCVYENLLSSLLYLSMANSGMAYMGVGRNIMYRKNILNRSVLDKNKDLASGDDDLSVNTLSSSHKVGICLLNDSFVFTKPPANWSAYWRQKTRHYNTAHRYKIYHIILLSFYSITHYSFFVGLLILLFSEVNGLGQELSGY